MLANQEQRLWAQPRGLMTGPPVVMVMMMSGVSPLSLYLFLFLSFSFSFARENAFIESPTKHSNLLTSPRPSFHFFYFFLVLFCLRDFVLPF